MDKNQSVPASGLCHRFYQQDVCDINGFNQLINSIGSIDLVIPCTENKSALQSLHRWSLHSPTPLAFDADAYKISSSKLESDRLFARLGIPAPLAWPHCSFPVVAKPDSGSGSRGVRIFHNQGELEEFLSSSPPPRDWVLQQYLPGKFYSLEIVGAPGNYKPLQVTELHMDSGHDCMRVLAPCQLRETLKKNFAEIALVIAETIHLKGIMDIEVILHEGQLKVLEIDARLPSQTPTAVYHSTGINMLPMLAQCHDRGAAPTNKSCGAAPINQQHGVVYQHIKVSHKRVRLPGHRVNNQPGHRVNCQPGHRVQVCGEHIMAQAGPLTHYVNFFGADEAISDYNRDCQNGGNWCATLIIREKTLALAEEKCNTIISNIYSALD